MRSIAAAAALVWVAVLPPAPARADTPVRRTVERSVAGAPHVRIEDPTGDVRVVGDDGTAVRVTARIHAASDAAAESARVDVTHADGESAVVVTFPSPARGIWQIFDRRQISVDLVVNVPRASGLAVRVKTGDLDVAGMSGAVDVHSVTGDLHVRDVAADAIASTTTGDIVVDLAAGWKGMHLTAHTVTGDVRIRAANGLRAHVVARTRVGDVRNALGGTNAESPLIEARTNVGDVSITTR